MRNKVAYQTARTDLLNKASNRILEQFFIGKNIYLLAARIFRPNKPNSLGAGQALTSPPFIARHYQSG